MTEKELPNGLSKFNSILGPMWSRKTSNTRTESEPAVTLLLTDMELPEDELNNENTIHYLPHQPIIKEDKIYTKELYSMDQLKFQKKKIQSINVSMEDYY